MDTPIPIHLALPRVGERVLAELPAPHGWTIAVRMCASPKGSGEAWVWEARELPIAHYSQRDVPHWCALPPRTTRHDT